MTATLLYAGATLPDGRTVSTLRYAHAASSGRPVVTFARIVCTDGSTAVVEIAYPHDV